MAEEIDPARALATAKEKLIEERRSLAVAIALGYRRRRTDDPQANEARAAFIDLQNLIEAIDRAITHEKMIMNGRPASFVTPALETAPSATFASDKRQ
jgi:hypothetical protein